MYPAGMDGWTAAGLSETRGKCFSLDFITGKISSCLICGSSVSPNNVPLSSFHLLWSSFFLHSLPIFGLQRRFPKCKGKKLKSCFVLSSILSLSNISEYFQLFFCTSHAPHFPCNCDELDDLVLLKMSYVG